MPNNPNSWWNYGKSLELAERFNQAIEAFEKAKLLTPNNPKIRNFLVEVHIKKGRK